MNEYDDLSQDEAEAAVVALRDELEKERAGRDTSEPTNATDEESEPEPFVFDGFAPKHAEFKAHFTDVGPLATPDDKWQAFFGSIKPKDDEGGDAA